MFNLDKFSIKGEYKPFTKDLKIFFKLSAFADLIYANYGFPPNYLDTFCSFDKEPLYSYFYNYGDYYKILPNDVKEYFLLDKTYSNYYSKTLIRPNPHKLHELRKYFFSIDKNFYKNLLDKIYEGQNILMGNFYGSKVTVFILKMFLNIPIDYLSDEVNVVLEHMKHVGLYGEIPFVDMLSDKDFIKSVCPENYETLVYICTNIVLRGISFDKYFEMFDYIDPLINQTSGEVFSLYNYFKFGLNDQNKDSYHVNSYNAFLTGDFENAKKAVLEYRKEWKKNIENENLDFPYELTLILQFSRLILNKDISTLKRELSSSVKKFNEVKSINAMVANALLCLLNQKNGQESNFLSLVKKDSRYSKFLDNLYFVNCSIVIKVIILVAAYNDDPNFNIQKNNYIDSLKFLSHCFPSLATKLQNTFTTLLKTNVLNDEDSKKFFDFTKVVDKSNIWKTQIDSLKDILKINSKKFQNDDLKAKTKKTKFEKILIWVFNSNPNQKYIPYSFIALVENGDFSSIQIEAPYEINTFFSVRSAKHTYLSDQDRIIATNYIRVPGYRKNTFNYAFSIDRTLPSFVGHPYIFYHDKENKKFIHLNIEESKILLKLEEDNNSIKAKLFYGNYREDNIGFKFDLDNEKLFIYKFEKVHESLLEILGNDGTVFPKDALDDLILLGKSNDIILDLNIKSKKFEANTKPILFLLNQGKSYTAKLRFQLIDSEDSPIKIPGLGEPSVVFKKKNESTPIEIQRDLEKEIQITNDLTKQLSVLDEFLNEENYAYSSDSISSVLELLKEIKEKNLDCEIKWCEGKKYNVVGSVSSSKFGLSVDINANNYLSVSGNIELSEGRYMSLKNLLDSLDNSYGNFIKIDDDNFVAITSELKSRLEKLKTITTSGKKGEILAHPLAGNTLENLMGDIKCKFSERIGKIITKRDEAMNLSVYTPKTLDAELRSYQKEGFTWLYRLSQWGVGACLADDMGLGKTIQTITLILKLACKGSTLIVAPTSVCPNWEREIFKFAPSLIVKRLKESENRKEMIDSMKVGEILIVSYGLFSIEADLLSNKEWELAIFDEAQALKNSSTQRAKTATQINAKMRIALTGTPIENNLDDLWSIFNIINPGLLGTKKEFHSRFADISSNKNTNRMLKLLISPFILRRLKGDVLDDLPPRTEQVISVEPSNYEKELYETLRLSTIEDLEKNKLPLNKNGQRRLQILSALTKLRQFCCDPALISTELKSGYSSKTNAFIELLEEALSGGHRLLVFSQFVGYLTRIKKVLEDKGIEFQYLDGQTTEKNRAKAIEAFQTGQGDVFLISLKAGGQGLNLTGADYVVHLDPWWNPAVEDQATDRAYRIGQTRPVNVFRIVIKDSLEEKILELHSKKREIAADFLEGTASVANEAMKLSEEELLSLIG